MLDAIINPAALEPLYLPWEEPTKHRVRAKREGEPAVHEKGRRPSTIVIAQNLRQAVGEWRQADYAYGCSETTRELLLHWFWRAHRVPTTDGNLVEFNYYFCQREAIETLIYLMEVRGLTSLSAVTAEFGGREAEVAALGINPEEDLWARYGFKVATGAGKTKIMSLAIVWSYFHALRESDSPLAKHFLVIAPNLTVFERLKDDFEYGRIFDRDPLIPPAWRGDWNLSVVLQDEASGAATGGVLYLTNIHRLYEPKKRTRPENETYDWMGPPVSRAKALDTGEALRERVTSHPRLMVLNDEAHHVWDPDSAWNEALAYLDTTLRERTGSGLVAQLDFSATPKDNKGNLFKHIICDAPLGEAVDAGIVKTPIIGRGQGLREGVGDDASDVYQEHLTVGYQRWLKSKEEWDKSGKKALMFVMCSDTTAADQIATRLNTDSLYAELNKKTINLHTNLKGKLKKRGKAPNIYYEFVENENEISEEDLKELRKLSRELDSDTSPYRCIVSVLMLREGWDVRNVTTIVPLRPYSSKANILPEQTLGRGLRRMTLPGQAAEVVTVVEHSAFTSLYQDELAQEGLPIEIVDVDKVPRTTVSIFPDAEHKDLQALNLLLPHLSAAYSITPQLGDITFDEVKKEFARFEPLPLGEVKTGEIEYEGRHLLTNEIVEQMKIKLPLLQSGVGAVSFFREELERITKVRGTHPKLAPLIQQFLEEVLFTEKTSLFDQRLIHRLSDYDVREHIRAVFVPLIRKKTTQVQKRSKTEDPISVTTWRPFQVTHSERHPTLAAERTPFNLVPCNHNLEVALARFADRAPDVAAFAKNSGPQALHIDYLAGGGRLAFYTPDFIIRKRDGTYLLAETKGREDLDVPAKARAAVEWCKSASAQGVTWSYLYLPEKIFQSFNGNEIAALARACAPALADLIHEANTAQMALPLYEATAAERAAELDEFISSDDLGKLPSRYRKAIEEAVGLFGFLEKKKDASLSPAFQPLLAPLDDAARGMILGLLANDVPTAPLDQQDFFDPYYSGVSERDKQWLRQTADNLKKTLVYKNGVMPLGLLAFCLAYPQNKAQVGGVFACIRKRFAPLNGGPLAARLDQIKDFRNKYIAHQERELTDAVKARQELKLWIQGLQQIYWAHH
ncbi:MAG TPA: DEAD/DEAH box helicase family protein [Anaerolineae bacterium]|nr:DEAD/DEAH box helicase family protein [Anaerolineae bacterium]